MCFNACKTAFMYTFMSVFIFIDVCWFASVPQYIYIFIILILHLSDANPGRDPGTMRAEQKTFNTLGVSAAMPTPTCTKKKCLSHKVLDYLSKQSKLFSRHSTEHQ